MKLNGRLAAFCYFLSRRIPPFFYESNLSNTVRVRIHLPPPSCLCEFHLMPKDQQFDLQLWQLMSQQNSLVRIYPHLIDIYCQRANTEASQHGRTHILTKQIVLTTSLAGTSYIYTCILCCCYNKYSDIEEAKEAVLRRRKSNRVSDKSITDHPQWQSFDKSGSCVFRNWNLSSSSSSYSSFSSFSCLPFCFSPSSQSTLTLGPVGCHSKPKCCANVEKLHSQKLKLKCWKVEWENKKMKEEKNKPKPQINEMLFNSCNFVTPQYIQGEAVVCWKARLNLDWTARLISANCWKNPSYITTSRTLFRLPELIYSIRFEGSNSNFVAVVGVNN